MNECVLESIVKFLIKIGEHCMNCEGKKKKFMMQGGVNERNKI